MKLRKWTPRHPLDGPRMKIVRAESHLKRLDAALGKYRQLKPYRLDVETRDKERVYVYRIDAVVEPPRDLGLLVGEIAYHLRSALDQIIWPLSGAESLSEQAQRRVTFPIFKDRNPGLWEQNLNGVKDNVRDVVNGFQPYIDGERAEYHRLWVLNEIATFDRHRFIHMANGVTTVPKVAGIEVSTGRLNDGDVVAVATFDSHPKETFEPYVTFDVMLPVGRPDGGVRIAALRDIHEYVRDKVLPAFVRFFPDSE